MRRLLVIILFLLSPTLAIAQPRPSRAPVPHWVERLPIPDADPAQRERAVQALLINAQTRYSAEGHEYFNEMAFLAQTREGLAGLGNITLPWQPDQSDLVVHHVEIRRAGATIDLLANGRDFTVLRRESGLETATLDGVLTAVLQAEGLAVGDTLVMAFSIRQRPGALPLRAENFLFTTSDASARRFYVRQIWPTTIPMRWRGTGAMAGAQVRRTAAGNELVLDLRDVVGERPPENAPPRFNLSSTLQLTDYRDWAELSREFAPFYERASTLAGSSPLQAEIDRISRTSSDPRQRAMAALRLVQDEVRYLALVMGDGNYLPAAADETWSRRYGDCKAKTALLLALLRGLGIEAEPVLVNAAMGDALGELLPQRRAFDHVVVRARIDGRSYWLDGTRSGDRDFDALASSRFGWGLPLRSTGAALEPLPFQPSPRPAMETRFTYDASRGLLGVVPATGEIIFRREMAALLRALEAQQGAQVFAETVRGMARSQESSDLENFQISHDFDDDSGEFVIRMSGTERLNWSRAGSAGTIAYQFSNDTLTWQPDVVRETGTQRDAPFSLAGLVDHESVETVILPRGGNFTLSAENFDRNVAGVRISRVATIENGRAVVRTAFRPQQLEIPAAEARAALPALREIADKTARVNASSDALSRSDRRAMREAEPNEADSLVQRGFEALQAEDLDRAEADFRRASELSPTWSRPLSNLALIMFYRGNLDEAERLLADAEQLSTDDFVTYQVRGLIQLRRNRPVQAITAFTQSLALDPNNVFNLFQRAVAYQRLGEMEDALADFDAILEREPNHRHALWEKARIHVFRNEADRALAATEAMVAADPTDPALLNARAGFLKRLGRNDEAAAAYSAALRALDARLAANPDQAPALSTMRRNILQDSGQPAQAIALIDAEIAREPNNVGLLNERCWARAIANLQLREALADCDRGISIRAVAPILDSRAFVRLQLGDFDGAIADANAALELSPLLAESLYVRGMARLRRGDRAAGEQDLAAARRLRFDIDAEYQGYGVTPEGRP